MMYSKTSAVAHDNRPQERSKKIPKRTRQSAFKDTQILKKISAFPVPGGSHAGEETSVVTSTHPPITPSTPSVSTPANDNLIPVWDLTSDHVKAWAATAALTISETPAHAFVFNLTHEAHENALRDPRGFVKALKIPFDRELKRAGLSLPYWFCIDIEDGRLHIQGAFGASPDQHQLLKGIMRKAWGEWKDHKQFQIWISPKPCDDGWAVYSMRKRPKVRRKIGDHTFTITRPLQQDAEWTYGEIRRIMREASTPGESETRAACVTQPSPLRDSAKHSEATTDSLIESWSKPMKERPDDSLDDLLGYLGEANDGTPEEIIAGLKDDAPVAVPAAPKPS